MSSVLKTVDLCCAISSTHSWTHLTLKLVQWEISLMLRRSTTRRRSSECGFLTAKIGELYGE